MASRCLTAPESCRIAAETGRRLFGAVFDVELKQVTRNQRGNGGEFSTKVIPSGHKTRREGWSDVNRKRGTV